MRRTHVFVAVAIVLTGLLLSGCATKPAKSDLVSTLQQVNGLSHTQSECVANGLFNGIPSASPPIRALTMKQLKAVAKPDNAGKVPAEVTQTLRDVVAACIPATSQPGS